MSYYLYPWLGCNLRLHNTLGLFYLFRPMDYESMNKMPTFPEHITSFFFHVGNNNYRDGKTKKKKSDMGIFLQRDCCLDTEKHCKFLKCIKNQNPLS